MPYPKKRKEFRFIMLIDNFPHIQPIRNINSSLNPQQQAQAARVPGAVFTDALQNAINNIRELSAISNAERTRVLLGETDDLHTSLIASQRSGLAQDLFMQQRNRLMEAYSEILRMQI